MLRCPRCPNGAVVADAPSDAIEAAVLNTAVSSPSDTLGTFVDLTLTLTNPPNAYHCRNCDWRRTADGMSHPLLPARAPVQAEAAVDGVPSPSMPRAAGTLFNVAAVPFTPDQEARGRTDDLIQGLLELPRGVLCTVCGGPSERVAEEAIKALLPQLQQTTQPPSDATARASWWGFKSKNFEKRPIMIEWFYVLSRAAAATAGDAAALEENAQLCVGCGRCCAARYFAPPASPARVNPNLPLPDAWRRRTRVSAGVEGAQDAAGDVEPIRLVDDFAPEAEAGAIAGAGAGAGASAIAGPLAGAAAEDAAAATGTLPPVEAVAADAELLRRRTCERQLQVNEVRVMEEARRGVWELMDTVVGPAPPAGTPPGTLGPKSPAHHHQLWQLAGLLWSVVSSMRAGEHHVQWSIARDVLVRSVFTTEQARRALDTLLPRDPRDPDLLLWEDIRLGPHTRAGVVTFLRRMHERVPLEPSAAFDTMVQDALEAARRAAAVQRRAVTCTPAPALPDAAAHAVAAEESQGIRRSKILIREVRLPVLWVTAHAVKLSQARTLRFALWMLRAVDAAARTAASATAAPPHLDRLAVSVPLMERFLGDATMLHEGSLFSLIGGLRTVAHPALPHFVVLDLRDENLRRQVTTVVDRLLRMSRGANWELPNRPQLLLDVPYAPAYTNALAEAAFAPAFSESPAPTTAGARVMRVVAAPEVLATLK